MWLSGLGTWVVGNPKDPGGGTDFEFDFEHAVPKEMSSQSAVWLGGLEVSRILCISLAYSLSR